MDLSGSWKYIERIAKSRLATNKTQHHVYQYGEDIEVLGAAGEIVARRDLGLPEKLQTDFDGGVDLRFGGMKIDVKATHLTPLVEHRYLQWPEWKNVKSDIILLTGVNLNEKIGITLGYATRSEILNAPINKERATPCHEISVRDLHPVYELVARSIHGNGH